MTRTYFAEHKSEQKDSLIQHFGRNIAQEMNPTAWLFLGLWVAVMIPMPHVRRLAGEPFFLAALNISVLLQAGAVMAILAPRWGWRRTGIALGIVAVLSWGMEALGASTGFPFGSYDYTERLQPQIFHVPLLIPVAWWMMLGPSWAVARTVGRFRESPVRFALLSGLAITAWDLFLDPQMVDWGLWVWEFPRDLPAGYFGIPWVNFGGWVLTGFLITLAVRPNNIPIYGLLLIYAITWALESIGLSFFFGLPGPALAGFVVMGIFLGLSVWALNKQHLAAQS